MRPPEFIYGTDVLARQKSFYDQFPWLQEKVRPYRCIVSDLPEENPAGNVGVIYKAIPCGLDHQPILGAPEMVVKIPLIDPNGHRTLEQNRARCEDIRKQNLAQLTHINARLEGSPHFNPIIDLAEVPYDKEDLQLPVTVQPFLTDSIALNDWIRYREGDALNMAQAQSDWYGIASRKEWCTISLLIAHALKHIHLRRVTHADIHPGNIFITKEPPYRVIFIDFGESFVATPERKFRSLKLLRPYHAPELAYPGRTNESLDVYSFGILLLYLATGKAERLNSDLHADQQRQYLNELVSRRNPRLMVGDPRVLDLLAGCTMVDPANRPRMVDVCNELAAISSGNRTGHDRLEWPCCPHESYQMIHPPVRAVLDNLYDLAGATPPAHHPVLLGMLRREVQELAMSFSTIHTEMVDLYGSRDRMLRVLIDLVDNLQSGDSWTSATSLNLWQGSALGMAGRYSSACIRAILRGASIRRTLITSVEELGLEYSEAFAEQLKTAKVPELRVLGEKWLTACRKFENSHQGVQFASEELHPDVFRSLKWHQERLQLFLRFWGQAIREWRLEDPLLDRKEHFKITESRGFRLSFHPVPTREEAEDLRAYNPAVLAYLPSVAEGLRGRIDNDMKLEEMKWLLIVAEMRGRRDATQAGNRPHLIGVRVYPSVFRTPDERVKHMEKLFKEAVNVTAHLEEMLTLGDRANSGR